MRPRVIPADDLTPRRQLRLRRFLASMRPRVIPADDPEANRSSLNRLVASMRPRVIPADDLRLPDGEYHDHASMRPRVIPADDPTCAPVWSVKWPVLQ